MCGGGGDSGASQRAATAERERLEAERELERMKAEQATLLAKEEQAVKEAEKKRRQRDLIGRSKYVSEEELGSSSLLGG